MWCHIVLGIGCLLLSTNAQTLGGYCKTPLNEPAKCISAYECKSLQPLLRLSSRTSEQTDFLHSSSCGFDSQGVPYVCCGTSVTPVIATTVEDEGLFKPNPLIPDRNNCGLQYSDRIFNGEQTAFDEFPWMAVIQYIKSTGMRTIACAGSLINPRYILTAAHCVKGKVLVKVGQLINIRLGEYNTTSPGRDCLTIKNIHSCNQEEVNVAIEEVIPHPKYDANGKGHNDIALIRLASEVRYSDFIRPICLPLPNEASVPGDKVTVAGWGKTERGRDSDVKLKLQIPVVSQSQCSNAFAQINVEIADTHICAGGEAGRDSCTGDSGGPLMRTLPTDNARWMIEGIVSFGARWCGSADYPGVYTKVAKYVSWIHRNVRA